MSQPPTREGARLNAAKSRLLTLIEEQGAVVKAEAVTRLAETFYRGETQNIDPHVTGRALDQLIRAGALVATEAIPTRGGRAISTIQLADQTGRKTATEKAAARKRLLYGRYLGWASGSERYPNGLIGPAGETAVRRGIIESAAMQTARPNAGEVDEILNVRLPGPADSGGYLSYLRGGIPQPPVTTLIEVKSLREWIYPTSSELFQVLHKCVLLKQRNPDVPVVPILVCRRAQKSAIYMARRLGFFIIEMRAQFVGTTLTIEEVDEVRNELGFSDLRMGTGPSLPVRDRLNKHLPPYLNQYTEAWTTTTGNATVCDLLQQLRRPMSARDRQYLVNDLRVAHRSLIGEGGW